MNYTKKELHQLELCLGRCNTCSEQRPCALKTKVDKDDEIDGTLYDAQCGYYGKLYGLTRS